MNYARRAAMAAMAMAVAGAVAGAGAYLGAIPAWSQASPPSLRGSFGPFVTAPEPKPLDPIAFTAADGSARTLADFAGRVVLLNFWATWCVPCVEEMPALDRLQGALGGPGFEVVALSIDRQGKELVVPFLARLKINRLAVYLDPPGRSMRALGVRGLPTTLLIDRQGREVGRLEGAADWDAPAAQTLIRHYMGPAG